MLSKNFFSLCKTFSPELIKVSIIPLFLEFLKDKNNEIRINLVCDLYKIIEVVDIHDIIEQITPFIEEISKDKNWRIRQQNAQTYGFIAKNIVYFVIKKARRIFQNNFLEIPSSNDSRPSLHCSNGSMRGSERNWRNLWYRLDNRECPSRSTHSPFT